MLVHACITVTWTWGLVGVNSFRSRWLISPEVFVWAGLCVRRKAQGWAHHKPARLSSTTSRPSAGARVCFGKHTQNNSKWFAERKLGNLPRLPPLQRSPSSSPAAQTHSPIDRPLWHHPGTLRWTTDTGVGGVGHCTFYSFTAIHVKISHVKGWETLQ